MNSQLHSPVALPLWQETTVPTEQTPEPFSIQW